MIIHTFLDKCATIVKNSYKNLGLSPIGELNMGTVVSRVCIHFNTNHLVELYNDKTLANKENVRHILKLTNCSSVNINDTNQVYAGVNGFNGKNRASSFDVILFTLPKDFDEGRGYEYEDTFWYTAKKRPSSKGCTWYDCRSNKPWYDEEFDTPDTHFAPGVYDTNYLYQEYKKVINGEKSDVIIATQHFDYGGENFELDITDYVNEVVEGKRINHGLCLAYSPDYETHEYKTQEYVGFFTNNTNTFFEPYVETIYSDFINDDRRKFYSGKENRLYFFTSVGGEMVNLDQMPTCTIDGVSYEVHQTTKGAYYANVRIDDIEEETIFTDVWSNLLLNGEHLSDVELDFVVLPKSNYLTLGKKIIEKKELVPNVYGINDAERIKIGDVRRVGVDFRIPYSTSLSEIYDKAEFRVYVKDANREVDVYPYFPIETTFEENYFIIDSTEMVPNDYYVDIKTHIGLETKVYKEVLRFTIVSNITNFYV